jgi:hypothetical protein
MARANKLSCKAYIDIDGQKHLWYEVDIDGKVTWHLPKDISRQIKKRMLENIGRNMSDYINNHPEATLWGATNLT